MPSNSHHVRPAHCPQGLVRCQQCAKRCVHLIGMSQHHLKFLDDLKFWIMFERLNYQTCSFHSVVGRFFVGGVWPPLRVMMHRGLEQRLLELLQLQSPNVQLLTQRPTAQLQGTPFYFFAPKAETTIRWTHGPNMLVFTWSVCADSIRFCR